MIPLCPICLGNAGPIDKNHENVSPAPDPHSCALCFGLLSDMTLCDEIVNKAIEEYKQNGYDGHNFILALNLPITMHLREAVLDNLLGGKFVPATMSPKNVFANFCMSKIGKASGLHPSLKSDLILTVTVSNDEFCESDAQFLNLHFPEEFRNSKSKKRHRSNNEAPHAYSKVKINNIESSLTIETAKKYPMSSPTQRCAISVKYERDSVYIAGRYCKYSRSLPQSPWAADDEALKAENSISEKVGLAMTKLCRADTFRFVASGREDIDVRMLGQGRPFAVNLINARTINALSSRATFDLLAEQINQKNPDIKVNFLTRVTAKEVLELNVGQEEKRKTYSALCYSKVPLTEEIMHRIRTCAPVEISQKTVIRVLKRRPLIDRKRTIFSLNAYQLDEYHFIAKLETQAGTYVKEFVHGDFGRTRPCLPLLMGLELDQVDILQLDVEEVDLEWPPKRYVL